MVDDSLDWLAAQYVLGELPESEQIAFEERLVHDLEACKSIARASRLLSDVRTAISVQIPAVQTTLPRSGSWLVVMAATAVCLLFACWMSIQSDRTNELAATWQAGGLPVALESDDSDDEQDMSPDATVPDWLMAGVMLEAGEQLDGPGEETKDN